METESSGKLFGVIPISFKSKILVEPGTGDGEPSVSMELPWYSFLVNENVDKDDIEEAAAKEKKKPKPKESINIESFSFGASNAGMYRAISNVLKSKHDTVKNSVGNAR
jgi:hypothetical protein